MVQAWTPKGTLLSSGAPKTTKIMSYMTSGFGQTVFTGTPSRSDVGFRIPVQIDVTTTKWRVKMRNYDCIGTAKTALTGKGIKAGVSAGTGAFMDPASVLTVTSGDFSIPGNGTWYYSEWVTDPAQQLQSGMEYLIASGWTNSAVAVQGCAHKWWYHSTAAGALNVTGAIGSLARPGSNPSGLPVDFMIEYEETSSKKSCLWIGDSISEGVKGNTGTALATTAVLERVADNYPTQWGRRNNILVQNISGSGFTVAAFNLYPDFENRADFISPAFDMVVIALGTNDFQSKTLATYQADMTTLVNSLPTKYGVAVGKPLYFVSPTMRNDGTNDPKREQYIAWLKTRPLGASGYVDIATGWGNGSDASNTITSMFTCDNIHPSFIGEAVATQAASAAMPGSILSPA